MMDAKDQCERPLRAPDAWLRRKLRAYFPHPDPRMVASLLRAARGAEAPAGEPGFDNPFTLDDLASLDDETLRGVLASNRALLPADVLAVALRAASPALQRRVRDGLSGRDGARFDDVLRRGIARRAEQARGRLLDAFFWELTYRKTPQLYEALTEGERMHPALFPMLEPWLRGRVVLDAGAGSGRATLECLRRGAERVYAVEPSPGLLRLLGEKARAVPGAERIAPMRGRFDALPLADASVDTALSCSAFTSLPNQGGEAGLRELRRVTRAGGVIVIIWPRPEDYGWLAARGFRYVALPARDAMSVRYRSLAVALRVAHRFYAGNTAVLRHLLRTRRPEAPYRLLGNNPPHDFCWLRVER
jgi:SAM-dependent methyltransferase